MIDLHNQVRQALNVLWLFLLLYLNFLLKQFLIQVSSLMQNGQDQLTNGSLVKKQIMVFDNSWFKVVHELFIVLSNVCIVVSVPLLQLLNLRRNRVLFMLIILYNRLLQLLLKLRDLLLKRILIRVVHRLEMLAQRLFVCTDRVHSLF